MARDFDRSGHFELCELRKENHNGQTIHEAQHHRMRHKANKLAPLHHTGENLQQSHQNHCGKEVLNSVLGDQSDHYNGQGPCGPRDHTRAPTENRRDQTHKKRRIEPDQRMHPRHKGKGHRLGHQSQGHGQTRQKLNTQPRH